MTAPREARVLLIRIGAIGNALVSVPSIRALRQAWPKSRLTLVADPLTLELMKACPYIDEFVRYDNTGPEKAGPGYVRFIMDLRRRMFTHAIHFRRFLRSELMGLLSGAPVRIGFKSDARLQLLTHKVEYVEGESVIEQNLKLVRALGIDANDRRLEYWPERESRRVGRIEERAAGGGPLVVIHPSGATQQERLWPCFGELGKLLRDRISARVVYVGAESERGQVEEAAGSLDPPAPTAVGLRLPEAAELIRRAGLFVGTDSGPAHLADAVGTPGAIIYAPHRGLDKQLEKWKPEGPNYLAFTPPRDCGECPEHPCPLEKQKECASSIPVEEVALGLQKLYSGTGNKD